MTIDMVAPAVPTGLTWTDSASNTVASGGSTELSNGSASWNPNAESDLSHYIYKYWNTIASSSYNGEANAWVNSNVTSVALAGAFNQGFGTHYFCVEAVDLAGNVSACSTPFSIVYAEAVVTPPVVIIPPVTPVTTGRGGGGIIAGVTLTPTFTPVETPKNNETTSPETTNNDTPAESSNPSEPTNSLFPSPETPTSPSSNTPNPTPSTGGTGGTGRGTGGSFNPADATLDAGGGNAVEDPIVEEFKPADATLDIGG
jgi:hypothetical protein